MLTIVLAMAIGAMGLPKRADAQATEIAQLLLNVEKLVQFKRILSDMKKGYEILNGGYTTIKNISEGNFSLHKAFLDGLMQVSPEVRNYRKVAGIINYQLLLVREYRAAFQRYRNAGMFRADEIAYMERVYAKLFKESLRNLDELAMVVTAGKLRMSDDERLKAIDDLFVEMENKLRFLRHFNNGTSILALQREREKAAIEASAILNGVNQSPE